MCENIVCTIHMTFGNYAVFSHVLYAEFVFEYRSIWMAPAYYSIISIVQQ